MHFTGSRPKDLDKLPSVMENVICRAGALLCARPFTRHVSVAPPGLSLLHSPVRMSAFTSSFLGVAPSVTAAKTKKSQRRSVIAKAVDVSLAPPTTRTAPKVPEGTSLLDGCVEMQSNVNLSPDGDTKTYPLCVPRVSRRRIDSPDCIRSAKRQHLNHLHIHAVH